VRCKLLAALHRHPNRAANLHFIVKALRHLNNLSEQDHRAAP
jgi:hypothetical protein